MPETPSIPRAPGNGNHRDSVPAMLQRSPSKLAGAFSAATGTGTRRRRAGSGGTLSAATLSTEEKQELLSRHLSRVRIRTLTFALKGRHIIGGHQLGSRCRVKPRVLL